LYSIKKSARSRWPAWVLVGGASRIALHLLAGEKPEDGLGAPFGRDGEMTFEPPQPAE
jgi:hypothetical protein